MSTRAGRIELFQEEDCEENQNLREETPELVGSGLMRPGVKSGKLL